VGLAIVWSNRTGDDADQKKGEDKETGFPAPMRGPGRKKMSGLTVRKLRLLNLTSARLGERSLKPVR